MPSPQRSKRGKPHLKRDAQQWFFDWMVKETGRVFHFQPDGRGRLPRTVKSHSMIAKHMGLAARRMERLAQAEAEAGHRETAMELYFQAALDYLDAQHVVFETNDDYFDYYRDYHAFWKLYGIDLPDDVLRKLYYANALRITPGLPQNGWPR